MYTCIYIYITLDLASHLAPFVIIVMNGAKAKMVRYTHRHTIRRTCTPTGRYIDRSTVELLSGIPLRAVETLPESRETLVLMLPVTSTL